VLATGALSCVKVTVTNQRKGNLAVNPLYFSITDSSGEKHESSDALGEYEGQIDTTTLAPGEKAKGLVCGKGKFTPAVVAMTDELLQEQARAEVA
jgi:flagellar hook assembly protein FlgD